MAMRCFRVCKILWPVACVVGATSWAHGNPKNLEIGGEKPHQEEHKNHGTPNMAHAKPLEPYKTLAQALYNNITLVGPGTTSSKVKDLARGRHVLVVAFAPWCQWCMKEIPQLHALQAHMGDTVLILVVSIDDALQGTIAQEAKPIQGQTLAFYYSPELNDVMAQHGILGVPAAFLFRKDGTLIMTHHGYAPWDTAENIKNLKEKLNINDKKQALSLAIFRHEGLNYSMI